VRRRRVGVLGASGSWHTRRLLAALAARGHEALAIPATRLRSEVSERGDVHVLGPDDAVLNALDLLLVRGLPRGPLDHLLFRMDALHVLVEHAVRCVNSPRALPPPVAKSLAGPVPPRVRLPTPLTLVCAPAPTPLCARSIAPAATSSSRVTGGSAGASPRPTTRAPRARRVARTSSDRVQSSLAVAMTNGSRSSTASGCATTDSTTARGVVKPLASNDTPAGTNRFPERAATSSRSRPRNSSASSTPCRVVPRHAPNRTPSTTS